MQPRFRYLTSGRWKARWVQDLARPSGVVLTRSGLGLLAVLVLLAALETSPHALVAEPGNALQARCFAGFRNYQAGRGARATRPGCRLVLEGFGSAAKVDVVLTLARPVLPAGLSISANGEPAPLRESPDQPRARRLTTSADAAGRLVLSFAHSDEGPPLSLTRVDARQEGRSWPPWRRMGIYALALVLAVSVRRRTFPEAAPA